MSPIIQTVFILQSCFQARGLSMAMPRHRSKLVLLIIRPMFHHHPCTTRLRVISLHWTSQLRYSIHAAPTKWLSCMFGAVNSKLDFLFPPLDLAIDAVPPRYLPFCVSTVHACVEMRFKASRKSLGDAAVLVITGPFPGLSVVHVGRRGLVCRVSCIICRPSSVVVCGLRPSAALFSL